MIKDNVLKIREEINTVCRKIGRNPAEITLVGVTKYAPVEAINEAVAAGLTDIAENRVQEGERKYPTVTGEVKRHLIGHLQTNKAKDAIKIFDLIQSVDTFKLAQEIEKQAAKADKTVDILVQINTAEEEQKFGATKEEGVTLIGQIGTLPHVRIQGLMAMAPYTEDQSVIRKAFSDLRAIRDRAKSEFEGHERIGFRYLSMGMSSDFQIALEEGSNMIRVGSAIFKEAYVTQP